MVSLLPTIDGRLFKIEGGNRLLPVALLERAGAKVYNHRVLHVNRTGSTWLLGVEGAGSQHTGKGARCTAAPQSSTSKNSLSVNAPRGAA